MPYRRLPNTDAARLRALKTALQQHSQQAGQVPYSSKLVREIELLLPAFERAIAAYKQSIDSTDAGNKYRHQVHLARMYVSHFIQVLNLCCQRGEIKPEKKLLYKLLPVNNSVPDLSTENALLEWGKNIIDGEAERMRSGGTPIYNPPIAKVQVHYDHFRDAYMNKKVSRKNSARFLEGIQQQREQADKLILELWNSIEQAYASLGMDGMQEAAKEYGVVYYMRRKERQAAGLPVKGDEGYAR